MRLTHHITIRVATMLAIYASVMTSLAHAESIPPLTTPSEETSIDQVIKIGAPLCLTGGCADWGSAALRGAQLAAREINSRGGIRGKAITLVTEDTQETLSGAHAVSAFRNLAADPQLHFMIGPSWSPGALAIAPLAAKRADLLMITPSASAQEFNRMGSRLFNIRPVEDLSTESLAAYTLRNSLSPVAILTSSQPAEARQATIFREAIVRGGGRIAEMIEVDPASEDLRTEVTRIVGAAPKAVFVMAYNQMEGAMRAFRTSKYPGVLLGISVDDARAEGAKGMLDGLIIAKAPAPSPVFFKVFQQEYGENPGLSAENGYDAMYALKHAIEEANSFDPAVVAAALARLRFDGAAGAISFNPERGVILAPALYTIRQNKLVPLDHGTVSVP